MPPPAPAVAPPERLLFVTLLALWVAYAWARIAAFPVEAA